MKTLKTKQQRMNFIKENFEIRWENVIPQALKHFEDNVKRINKKEPDHYSEDPTELFEIKGIDAKFEFIMNHDYWIRIWTAFISKMLIDEVYRNQELSLKTIKNK